MVLLGQSLILALCAANYRYTHVFIYGMKCICALAGLIQGV